MTIAALLCLFLLAFLVTPYWTVLNWRALPRAAVQAGYLGAVVLLGILWASWTGSSVRVNLARKDILLGLAAAAGVFAVNYRALESVIPWRGDEFFHLGKTLALATRVPALWYIGAIVLIVLAVFLAWKNPRWAIVPIAAFSLGAIALFAWADPFSKNAATASYFLRYPYVSYWLYALVPRIAATVGSPYHEFLYRIVPAASAAGIVYLMLPAATRTSMSGIITWALATATIPVIFYYSSIEYLEMPAILLMLLVCLRIGNVVSLEPEQLKQEPAWYALVLIGFIKETAAPFLATIILLRFASFAWGLRSRDAHADKPASGSIGRIPIQQWVDQCKMAFSIVAPWALYIGLRAAFAPFRDYEPSVMNLVDPTTYLISARAFIEQYGLFLMLFIGGCTLLVLWRERAAALCLLLLTITTWLFFSMDRREYIGYSRFELYLAPMFLAGSKPAIEFLTARWRLAGVAVALSILAVNVWQSPLNVDGTKKPGWGNYLIDTSDHYYPYRDALVWLKQQHARGRIKAITAYYSYPAMSFYFSQLDWKTPHVQEVDLAEQSNADPQHIANLLAMAAGSGANIVIYQLLGSDVPSVGESSGFILEKVVTNQAHKLLIYYRDH